MLDQSLALVEPLLQEDIPAGVRRRGKVETLFVMLIGFCAAVRLNWVHVQSMRLPMSEINMGDKTSRTGRRQRSGQGSAQQGGTDSSVQSALDDDIEKFIESDKEDDWLTGLSHVISIYGKEYVEAWEGATRKHRQHLIHCAVHKNFPKVIKKMVQEHGFDVNLPRAYDLCTPMHLAKWYHKHKVIDVLNELGADLALKNKFGEACYLDLDDDIAALMEKETENEWLNGLSNVILLHGKKAVEAWEDVTGKHRQNLIHCAVHKNFPKVVKEMAQKHGFDINLPRASDLCTPMHLAQWYQKQSVIDVLNELGADLTLTNMYAEACDDNYRRHERPRKADESEKEKDGERKDDNKKAQRQHERRGRGEGREEGKGEGRGDSSMLGKDSNCGGLGTGSPVQLLSFDPDVLPSRTMIGKPIAFQPHKGGLWRPFGAGDSWHWVQDKTQVSKSEKLQIRAEIEQYASIHGVPCLGLNPRTGSVMMALLIKGNLWVSYAGQVGSGGLP